MRETPPKVPVGVVSFWEKEKQRLGLVDLWCSSQHLTIQTLLDEIATIATMNLHSTV